jgi:predicted RNA-binding protein with PUA-like domain
VHGPRCRSLTKALRRAVAAFGQQVANTTAFANQTQACQQGFVTAEAQLDPVRIDRAFFYHSSCEVPAVVGVMKIASDAYPDPTQFDRKSKYYDPKSTKDRPRWFVVDVEFESKLARPVTLAEVREKKSLGDFRLIKRGNRLSVFPVSAKHWNIVQKLAGG